MIKIIYQKGFTLVELAIFIVVVGLIAAAILLAMSVSLQKSPTINRETTALALAQLRMELILGQRRINGFGFTDPCSGAGAPAVCTPLTGYTVTSSITTPSSVPGDVAAGYKLITVTASGLGDAVVKSLVGNY